MLLNADKCHLLLTGPDSPSHTMGFGTEVLNPSDGEKLLGIFIDSNLTFENYISRLCEKASQKTHALSRILPLLTFIRKEH